MIKKILLLLTIITLIGCNASKPIIVTTKKAPAKTRTSTVSNPNKSKPRIPASNRSAPAKLDKKNAKINNSEVIVSTSRTVVTNDIVKLYVYQYKNIAMANMKQYGIPASII